MILKIGIDLVDIKRIAKKINDAEFLKRILAPREIEKLMTFASLKRRVEFCAGRFAGKEALIKALPIVVDGLKYTDIVIVNDESGAPFVICEKLTYKIHISISHSDSAATAVVILENS